MKIKAKYGSQNVTIISFVPTNNNVTQAIYVTDDGKINSCYIGTPYCPLTVIDENYITQV